GRAAFGTLGIHVPSILRALVACGWFGIQTWIGGLAIAAILGALLGDPALAKDWWVQFAGFMVFWAIQMWLVVKGTESIKWLESLAAPLLIVIGMVMLGWGISEGGGLSKVLDSSYQFSKSTMVFAPQKDGGASLTMNLVADDAGTSRAKEWKFAFKKDTEADLSAAKWQPLPQGAKRSWTAQEIEGVSAIKAQFRAGTTVSSEVSAELVEPQTSGSTPWMTYLLWLTAMVAFWATLALNISDITRYAASQRDQVMGQFIGLPTTMTLYAFIGVAVTCAAIVIFPDILVTQDAPWDPIRLIARFNDQPVMMITAQLAILLATLSTNIAANVISPANSFANLAPHRISFRTGGLITGVVGIVILPWKLMGVIVGFLLTYGAILGPVVGVLLADYYVIRNKELDLEGLYQADGPYRYSGGFHVAAFVSLGLGVGLVLAGLFVPALKPLYDMGWFSGFVLSFVTYLLIGRKSAQSR
ncbi:MAG TPA: hypothetical protein DCQ06_00445, partial [Myxococcales bacterium]|nr:hypothetical protein [Myxococcales bacterium]